MRLAQWGDAQWGHARTQWGDALDIAVTTAIGITGNWQYTNPLSIWVFYPRPPICVRMQATVADSVSGSAATDEVTQEPAPVDLRTHPSHLTRGAGGYNRQRHTFIQTVRLQPPASRIAFTWLLLF